MTSLFSPKMPKAPEPVKPPTTDDTRQAEEDLMRLRRRRGRAATFLGGMRGRPSAASMLLGSGIGSATGAYTGNTGGVTTGGGSRGDGGSSRERK
jgi:hypothetical protein